MDEYGDIIYTIKDVERYCDLFGLTLDKEKIKDWLDDKTTWYDIAFENILDNLFDMNITFAAAAIDEYRDMIYDFCVNIPGYDKEETRAQVHNIVKEILASLKELQFPRIDEKYAVSDFRTNEVKYFHKTKEELLNERKWQIVCWTFSGLSCVSKNLYNFYNFVKNSSFEDVYERINKLYDEERDLLIMNRDPDFERYFCEDDEIFTSLLCLIACSKYAKDTDISDGYNEVGRIDGYSYNDCLDFHSLLSVVKKLKEASLSSKTLKKSSSNS